MGRAQKVVDRLDGIEGFDRHLHKGRIPVAHGAVPQSGEFERFQLLAVRRLGGDEACCRIVVLRQVIFFAMKIFDLAFQIHMI